MPSSIKKVWSIFHKLVIWNIPSKIHWHVYFYFLNCFLFDLLCCYRSTITSHWSLQGSWSHHFFQRLCFIWAVIQARTSLSLPAKPEEKNGVVNSGKEYTWVGRYSLCLAKIECSGFCSIPSKVLFSPYNGILKTDSLNVRRGEVDW